MSSAKNEHKVVNGKKTISESGGSANAISSKNNQTYYQSSFHSKEISPEISLLGVPPFHVRMSPAVHACHILAQ